MVVLQSVKDYLQYNCFVSTQFVCYFIVIGFFVANKFSFTIDEYQNLLRGKIIRTIFKLLYNNETKTKTDEIKYVYLIVIRYFIMVE